MVGYMLQSATWIRRSHHEVLKISAIQSRASRVAEVSRFKKCEALGYRVQKQSLPAGLQEMPRNPTASPLCSLSSSSFCLIPFQLWPPLLKSTQATSALLPATLVNSSQSCSMSPLLSSTLFTSSLLFSTPNDSHLCPPGLHSSYLFLSSSQLVFNSSHLLTSAQLTSPLSQRIWTLLTFSTLANSS